MKLKILFAALLLTTSAKAGEVKNAIPLPFFVSDTNPLKTLSMTGMSLNVVQGFPSFSNGTKNNHGLIQYGNKDALFLGMRLWKGAIVVFNPEIYDGYNISNNIGVASSVNVTLPRVETKNPYIQVQRLFLKQVIDLDGSSEDIVYEGGRAQALEMLMNRLTEKTTKNNIVLTIGKFSPSDVFDRNIYAHDPTRHFMNNTFNGMVNVDFAGNAWGQSIGGAVEWNKDFISLRAGLFQGSDLPPSLNLEPVALRSYMLITEAEARYKLGEQPGSIKVIGYQDKGYINNLGEYNGKASIYDTIPLFAKERMLQHTKVGFGINLQQQLTDGIGLFVRAGMDTRTYYANDITHSINGGFVFNGKLWNRENDEIGIAAGFNSMGSAYSYKGKSPLLIGTGSPNFAPETLLETYYKFSPWKNLQITADYQFLENPNFIKYSRPANVFGVRVRWNF